MFVENKFHGTNNQPKETKIMNSCPFGRHCEKGKYLDKFYGDKEKPCSTVYPTCHTYRQLKDEADKAKKAKKATGADQNQHSDDEEFCVALRKAG